MVELARGAGVVLFTQEALTRGATETLLNVLREQPPWSDLPVLVLVSRESEAETQLGAHLRDQVNATFIERPVGKVTLVRAASMALRARRRQYEVRAYLVSLAVSQEAERQARAVAEEAVRVRDDFLASVAHDLKNPLGAIKGFVQLLERRVHRHGIPEQSSLLEQLGRIDGMVTRATTQIEELLDVALLQAGQQLRLSPATVGMVSLLERVVAESEVLNTGQTITLHTPPAEVLGVWDQRRLETALTNVVGNALKYTGEDGHVWVGLELDGESILISVRDDGIGIPAADLPHVFERFYRAGNAGRIAGTGLGLAGVRQIVDQHGGNIAVQSVEGEGTVVTIRLPLQYGEQGDAVKVAG